MAKTHDIPPATIALYEKLVASHPQVERKGATVPYTSMNGHMFSFLTKTGVLALRLSPDDLAAFLKKYKTRQAVSHNTVMKEYAEVPASLLAKTRELKKYFGLSVEYIASLKPKPTTRKKAGKKAKANKKSSKSSKKKAAKKKTAKKKSAKKTAKKKSPRARTRS